MEADIMEIILSQGPLVLIALIFFKGYQEDREERRKKDSTLENNNKALEDLSKAVTALMTTIDRNNIIQETMSSDIKEIKDELCDVKKVSEKTYTGVVLNGKQNEAIIREAFNKRVSDEIKSEVKAKEIELEKDLADHDKGFYSDDM